MNDDKQKQSATPDCYTVDDPWSWDRIRAALVATPAVVRADILDALDFLESSATLKENHFNVPEINQHNALIAEKAEAVRLALFSVAATPAVGGEREALELIKRLVDNKIMTDAEILGDIKVEVYEALAAPPASPLRGIKSEALTALKNYMQADADGVMVCVSRQALDEAIAALSASSSEQSLVEDK